MTWPIREYRLSAGDLEHMLAAAKYAQSEGSEKVAIGTEHALELLDIALSLAKVREHKSYRVALGTVEVDRVDWSFDVCDEQYPGEAKDRRDLQDRLWELLTGLPYSEAFDEPARPNLRLVRDE